MRKRYVLYDDAGAIRQTLSCDDAIMIVLKEAGELYAGMHFVEDAGVAASLDLLQLYHVVGGVVAVKPTMPIVVSKTTVAADGTDHAELTGLPIPATLTVTGPIAMSMDVSDGIVEFTANLRGDYVLKISAPPSWLDWSTTIHAV